MKNTCAELAKNLKENIAKVIVGKDSEIELILTSVIAGGHVLMEDVPGTGKTKLAKSLARSLDMKFSRIQFTPDLLPGDVTGMSVYDQKTASFEFTPGPVFTNILLADEINRATPRTQSSLLECMEEKQVTVDGETRKLAAPFIVIATQNPIETQGTFPLPEAQLDRFLMRLRLGAPAGNDAVFMLKRFMSKDPLNELAPVASVTDITDAQAACGSVELSDDVLGYIVALAEYTAKADNVILGVSPRGMIAMMRASQALALVRGRDFVTPDDIKSLALPVFAHRVIARGAFGKTGVSEEIIRQALGAVPVPTEKARG